MRAPETNGQRDFAVMGLQHEQHFKNYQMLRNAKRERVLSRAVVIMLADLFAPATSFARWGVLVMGIR